jgi:hypothetical protein
LFVCLQVFTEEFEEGGWKYRKANWGMTGTAIPRAMTAERSFTHHAPARVACACVHVHMLTARRGASCL